MGCIYLEFFTVRNDEHVSKLTLVSLRSDQALLVARARKDGKARVFWETGISLAQVAKQKLGAFARGDPLGKLAVTTEAELVLIEIGFSAAHFDPSARVVKVTKRDSLFPNPALLDDFAC